MTSCGRGRCSLITSLCRPRKPLINLGPGRPFKNGTERRRASGIRETIAATASATSLFGSAPTPSACWTIRSTTAFPRLRSALLVYQPCEPPGWRSGRRGRAGLTLAYAPARPPCARVRSSGLPLAQPASAPPYGTAFAALWKAPCGRAGVAVERRNFAAPLLLGALFRT
jgi:hypothetical protein